MYNFKDVVSARVTGQNRKDIKSRTQVYNVNFSGI